MSPTQFHDHHRHAKKQNASVNGNAGLCPPPLKISKDSHLIKKSSSSSSSSSAASSLGVTSTAKPQQQRHPVIIYTHSPKVIQTHPKDFMALVQKLTGLSRDEDHHQQSKAEKGAVSAEEEIKRIDDNESSSVITDKNCEGQENSCFLPPLFDPLPAPFLTNIPANIPVFTQNSTDFPCVNQPFYNYNDLFFTPNMRSSISSSSGLERMNEFGNY